MYRFLMTALLGALCEHFSNHIIIATWKECACTGCHPQHLYDIHVITLMVSPDYEETVFETGFSNTKLFLVRK